MGEIEFKILDNGNYEISGNDMDELIQQVTDYQSFMKVADERMRSANEILKKRLKLIHEKQEKIDALEDYIDLLTAQVKSDQSTIDMYSSMLSYLLKD